MPQIQHNKLINFQSLQSHNNKSMNKTTTTPNTQNQKVIIQQQQQNKNVSINPSPIPLLLEENTNVCVSGNLNVLASNVTSLFKKFNTDVEFKSEKAKWKGKAIHRNRELSFRAYLYKISSKPNMFVLEFQRRSGCAMQFTQLYKNIYQELLKNGFVCSKQGEIKIPTTSDFNKEPLKKRI